jgi:hypothetical protein
VNTRTLKGPLHVEWVNVTYRSVWVAVLLVVAAAGGGGYWYWARGLAPKRGASAAIERAATRLAEVGALTLDESLQELAGNAKVQLDVARAEFERGDWASSGVAALRSEQLSLRVLASAGSDESQSQLATLNRMEGDVRVKSVGGFSWKAATERMVLRVGDQVKTSSSGSAEVLYFDGTSTQIAPGSLLEIRDLYEDPVTRVRRVREKLNWGEVQSSTQRRNVDGSFHEVATDKVAARTDEASEMRVAYDKFGKTSVVDVFGGRVELATDGRTATVAAGERITASADGQLSAKEALPGVPRLLLPSDQRVFVFEDPAAAKITLTWEAPAHAGAYRLMISDKPLFTDTLYDARRDGLQAVITGLAPGGYHWKVAAISKSGVEGPFSPPRRLRVSAQRIRDRADNEPPRLNIAEFVSIGQMVIINGETDPDARLWIDNNKVDVFEDGSFNAVVKLRRDGLNELLLVAQDPAGNETSLVRKAYVEGY